MKHKYQYKIKTAIHLINSVKTIIHKPSDQRCLANCKKTDNTKQICKKMFCGSSKYIQYNFAN